MEKQFWLDKWHKKEIGFHNDAPHPFLLRFFSRLNLAPGAHVFVPLCGKSLDVHWLIGQGFRVTGAELSETAVQELFSELSLTPQVETSGEHKRYKSDNLCVWVGDVLSLQKTHIAPVDGVYDRAALIALPEPMRKQYAQVLVELTQAAPQLLVTMEYDQRQIDGPPFSVDENLVSALYGHDYRVTLATREDIDGGFKTVAKAYECAWILN